MQQKSKPKPKPKPGKTTLKTGKKPVKDLSFPLEKENFVIIGAGIILIIIGYVLMAQNTVDGFVPTIISPVLQVIGYCVLIPYGILKKPGGVKSSEISTSTADTSIVPETSKSNIKTG